MVRSFSSVLAAPLLLSGCLLDPAEPPEQAPVAPQKASGKVRTARWVAESIRGMDGFSMRTDWYFRAEPFAVSWKSLIGRDWAHDVIDKRGHLHTASTWKDVSLIEGEAAVTE